MSVKFEEEVEFKGIPLRPKVEWGPEGTIISHIELKPSCEIFREHFHGDPVLPAAVATVYAFLVAQELVRGDGNDGKLCLRDMRVNGGIFPPCALEVLGHRRQSDVKVDILVIHADGRRERKAVAIFNETEEGFARV